MKKARLFLAATLMSAFIVVGASPAQANCYSDPNLPDPCVAVCVVGQGNKYTEKIFEFCNVW